MPAPFPAKGVANAFLNRSFSEKKSVEPMKLQKLIYLAHGYYLAATGSPLIDELFEAWRYGPVVPTIYHEFKHFGSQPITDFATEVDWDQEGYVTVPEPNDDAVANDVFRFVWSTYGNWNGLKLSDLSHKPDWAWSRVTKNSTIQLRNKDIDNSEIQKDFAPLVKKVPE